MPPRHAVCDGLSMTVRPPSSSGSGISAGWFLLGFVVFLVVMILFGSVHR
jgi:hypothetical protein